MSDSLRTFQMVEDLTHQLKDRLFNILKRHPDLKTYSMQSGDLVLVSESIKKQAYHLDITSYCGCIQAMPYAHWLPGGIRIFTKPMSITIGCYSRYDDFECYKGIKPHDNWEEQARKYNYSDRFIERVKEYLAEHPYKYINCWEEDDEE